MRAYYSITYSERVAEAGIERYAGSRGDSYDPISRKPSIVFTWQRWFVAGELGNQRVPRIRRPLNIPNFLI